MAERQRRVAELYLQSRTQDEIATLLDVNQATVSRDLAAIESYWAKAAIADLHTAKMRELTRIDSLEREYWEAWRRSQQEATKERVDVEGGRARNRSGEMVEVEGKVKRVREKKGRDGNHYFLAGIQTCIETRIRILGLDRLAETGEGDTVRALLDSLADLREASGTDENDMALAAPAASTGGGQES